MESPSFIGLVKNLAQTCFVMTKVERVVRKNNNYLTKVLGAKQRESADDQVIHEAHIAMVSMDYVEGGRVNIPYVSY